MFTLVISLGTLDPAAYAEGSNTKANGYPWPIKQERCATFYRSLARHIRSKNFYSSEDLKRFEAIHSNQKLSANERAKAIFETVLEARLRVLEPDHAASVLRVLKEAKIHTSDAFYGLAISDPVNKVVQHPYAGEIVIWRPVEIAETALEYFLKIHELEHAAQYGAIAKRRETGVLVNEYDYSFARYLSEDSAMALEWRYLNSIPDHDRQRLIEMVRQSRLDDYQKEFLERILANASLSLRDYLLLERKSDRYSKDQIIKDNRAKTILHKGQFWLSPVIAVGALYVMYESAKNIWQIMKDEASK